MTCGVWVWTGSDAKFILQCMYISLLEPSDIFSSITFAKNGHQIDIIGQLSVNDSVQFWDFTTKPGKVD